MSRGQFEFFQLRCFVAVAEELNFRRAAERLNMTQPPLSRQIKLLEQSLGVVLLERTNRQVSLTPAGANFLSNALELLQRAEYAALSARQADRGESGAIALGFVPSAAMEFVPRLTLALREALPDVVFNPTEMMSYEILEALRGGQLDFGLTRSVPQGGGIEGQRVIREPFVLVMPRTHPLAACVRVYLTDLEGVDLVAYSRERGGFIRDMQSALFRGAGIAPKQVVEVSQTHTVLALVNRGLGVALVPSSAQAMSMDNLLFRDVALPERFASELSLVYGPNGRSRLHARVQQVIIDALAGYIAQSPG
jgi:DNA-binding transcriptional LysR family regulator